MPLELIALLGFLALVPAKPARAIADSARVIQDALLDCRKSGKQLAADGAWDAASLSRQLNHDGLNFAGLYTAMRSDRAFAFAVLRRLCWALGVRPAQLDHGDAPAVDLHALAARVQRLEDLLLAARRTA